MCLRTHGVKKSPDFFLFYSKIKWICNFLKVTEPTKCEQNEFVNAPRSMNLSQIYVQSMHAFFLCTKSTTKRYDNLWIFKISLWNLLFGTVRVCMEYSSVFFFSFSQYSIFINTSMSTALIIDYLEKKNISFCWHFFIGIELSSALIS